MQTPSMAPSSIESFLGTAVRKFSHPMPVTYNCCRDLKLSFTWHWRHEVPRLFTDMCHSSWSLSCGELRLHSPLPICSAQSHLLRFHNLRIVDTSESSWGWSLPYLWREDFQDIIVSKRQQKGINSTTQATLKALSFPQLACDFR